MPFRGSFEPALHFAGPGHLQKLLFNAARVGNFGQGGQIYILQYPAVPPRHQRRGLSILRLRIDPRAIFDDRGGL